MFWDSCHSGIINQEDEVMTEEDIDCLKKIAVELMQDPLSSTFQNISELEQFFDIENFQITNVVRFFLFNIFLHDLELV